MKDLKTLLKTPLGDDDIKKVLGQNTRIIKYGDLDNYTTIDEVLSINNMVVILVETQINSGHWICMLKYDNVVEVFDSYGLKIDDQLKYVNLKMRKELDQYDHELSFLLDRCPYKVIYNNVDLQQWSPYINTCGRHVCLRLKNKNKTLDQYLKWVKSFKIDPDILVCEKIPI